MSNIRLPSIVLGAYVGAHTLVGNGSAYGAARGGSCTVIHDFVRSLSHINPLSASDASSDDRRWLFGVYPDFGDTHRFTTRGCTHRIFMERALVGWCVVCRTRSNGRTITSGSGNTSTDEKVGLAAAQHPPAAIN